LSSENRIGLTLTPSTVVYMISANLVTISLFRGYDPIKNKIPERGPPSPETVLSVIRIPFFPLTPTLAITEIKSSGIPEPYTNQNKDKK
jgi:hypothetical protein